MSELSSLGTSRRDDEGGGTTVFVDDEGTRRGHRQHSPGPPRRRRRRLAWTAITALAVALGLTAVFAVRIEEQRLRVVHPHSSHLNTTLPVKPDSYVGVYQSGGA